MNKGIIFMKKNKKKSSLWEVQGWRNKTQVYANNKFEAIKAALASQKVGSWEFPEARRIG